MPGRSPSSTSSKRTLTLVAVLAVLLLSGAGVRIATMLNSGPVTAPAVVNQTGSSAPETSGSQSLQPTAAGSRPATRDPSASPGPLDPPAAANGDRYAHNVQPGAKCTTAGARGFTADVKLMRCATTSADSRLRWRKP